MNTTHCRSSSRNSSCCFGDKSLNTRNKSSFMVRARKHRDSSLLAMSLLVVFVATLAQGALLNHPYRQIVLPDGTDSVRYANLGPIYAWLQKPEGTQPMADWSVCVNKTLEEFTVLEVLPDGLMVEQQYHKWNAYLGTMQTARGIIFLANYPGAVNCVDGQKIDFIALLNGVHRYTDRDGKTHSLPRYDYGVPYDPFQLARSVTNLPAGFETNVPFLKLTSFTNSHAAPR